ncbi:unnamed protein product, partial [marine sediment metagenome]
DLEPNREFFRDSGLGAGDYTYRVGAEKASSAPSDWAYSTTVQVISAPSAPQNLQLVKKTDKWMRVKWDDVDDEMGYKIEKSINETEYTEIAKIGENINEFLIRDLDPNTEYWIRVIAYNAAGDSGYSNVLNEMTLSQYEPTEFEKFIRKPSIELDALCEMNLGIKLTGFTQVADKEYTYELAITDRAINDFEKVYENGEEYTEKTSIDNEGVEATASTYYFNTSTKILYIHTKTGDNPTGFYIEGRFILHIKSGESATFESNFYLPLLSLDNIPSMSSEVSAFYGGSFTISAGTISLKNDEKTSPNFFDKRYADYLWRGGKLVLKIGEPGFTYEQYKEVFTSLIDRESCTDKLFTLKLRDLRANLADPISVNEYWLSNYPLMDDKKEGKVIPKVFGYREDIMPVCIDTENKHWKFHDGRIAYVHTVKVNDIERTMDTDFFVDYQRGIVTFARDFSLDYEKDIVEIYFTGIVDSALNPVVNGADIFIYSM